MLHKYTQAHLANNTVEVMVCLHRRRWDIIGSPPDLHLCLTMLGSSLSFI